MYDGTHIIHIIKCIYDDCNKWMAFWMGMGDAIACVLTHKPMNERLVIWLLANWVVNAIMPRCKFPNVALMPKTCERAKTAASEVMDGMWITLYFSSLLLSLSILPRGHYFMSLCRCDIVAHAYHSHVRIWLFWGVGLGVSNKSFGKRGKQGHQQRDV